MNDETVPTITPETPAQVAPVPRPLSYWLRRLLVCNPFFLASAMLLLYGMYRISIDANFLTTEVGQLRFNFTSLQGYELLLIVTAAVLARRRIWYDASLLVVLENLLILVPFILISQAALIDQRLVWLLCGAAAALAATRTEALRRRMRELWPAPRFFALGTLVLIVNCALPILYRQLHENKIGTKPVSGPAFEMNQLAWLLILPALCALVNLLQKPVADDHPLTQRRWFPHALFAFWLAGTAVHLYCLGYIYEFDLSLHRIAPALWVLAWTLFRKLPDFAGAPALRAGAMALPLPMALVAAGAAGSHIFATLMLLNVVAYAGLVFRDRDNRFALHLGLISLAALVAGAPVEWLLPRFAGFDRAKLIAMAVATYCVLSCIMSRNPKAGLLGAAVAMGGCGYLLEGTQQAIWWALQSGFVFFLLHSLRWRDFEHVGAAGVRIFVAGVWVVHSFVWVQNGAGLLASMILPASLLVGCVVMRLVIGCWRPVALPFAALAAASCAPVNCLITRLQSEPVGLLAIIGSFLLLGVGALVALTKHRWHPHPHPQSER